MVISTWKSSKMSSTKKWDSENDAPGDRWSCDYALRLTAGQNFPIIDFEDKKDPGWKRSGFFFE